MKLICMQTCDRPQLLRRTFEALSNCVGVEDYTIMVSAEPTTPEMEMVFTWAGDKLNLEIHRNSTRLFICNNTKASTRRAFDRSPRVIVLEDDMVFSKDALKYMEWGLDTYENDKKVWSIGCDSGFRSMEQAKSSKSLLRPDVMHRRQHFSCWGWAMWRDRYDQLYKEWPDNRPSWAVYCNQARQKRGMYEIYPEVSRSLQIGGVGVHMRDRTWFPEYVKGETFANDTIPQGYREI